jgi:hypothetical protein
MASQWHGNPAACLKSWENSCIHFVSNAFWPCARLNRCPWSYPTRNIPKSKIPTKIPTAIFGTLPTCLLICLLITDNIYWLETVLYKVIGWFIQLSIITGLFQRIQLNLKKSLELIIYVLL